MKIERITIKNYKSIKEIDLACSPKINAFVGENSSGKSNIFDAINWLLGPIYPSFNSTLPQDHFMGDISNQIEIVLFFDNGENLQLSEKWFDSYGHEKSGLNKSGGYVQDIARQSYCSAYLGVDRAILDYLPSNRWTLLGRILLEINSIFKEDEHIDIATGEITKKTDLFKQEIERLRDDILFSVKDKQGVEVMKRFIETLRKESAKQLNKKEDDFKVDLNLYDPWNFFRTLQLIVHESETGLSFQASNLGMGVQASISIAILKAYSQLKLRNNTPIFIDEPELFLHPQAQRNFYKVLCELAESGTQIFYTTHSPDFLSVGRFDEIFIVRKKKIIGTYVRDAQPSKFVADLNIRKKISATEDEIMLQYKNAFEETGDTQKANEAFFAKKIILVEGQSESLVLPYLLELFGFDYISKGISIVRCGGKNELDRFFRLYSEFGIPSYIIFDGDKSHIGTDNEADTITCNREILQLFGVTSDFPDNQVKDKYLGFEESFNQNLNFVTQKKGLALLKETRLRITNSSEVPSWISEIVNKLEQLEEVAPSILKTP